MKVKNTTQIVFFFAALLLFLVVCKLGLWQKINVLTHKNIEAWLNKITWHLMDQILVYELIWQGIKIVCLSGFRYMRSHYRFSVIIPTYNCARYLPAALNSLISQGEIFNDCQVLVVDDGSTDNTHLVAYEYCQKYPQNVFYLRKSNGNWGSVVNYVKIFQLAKGKLITILDADDVYQPGMLNEVSRYASKDMIVTDFYRCGQNKKKKQVWVYGYRLKKNYLITNKRIARTPHSQPLGKFYSKKIFYLLRDLQENRWYQDCIMYHMGVGLAHEIQHINKPLAVWNHQREGNSTTMCWTNSRKFSDWCSTLKLMNKHGAGLIVYVYALLPGFIKELKNRKKNLVLIKKPFSCLPNRLIYFLSLIWIQLKIRKYVKYIGEKY